MLAMNLLAIPTPGVVKMIPFLAMIITPVLSIPAILPWVVSTRPSPVTIRMLALMIAVIDTPAV